MLYTRNKRKTRETRSFDKDLIAVATKNTLTRTRAAWKTNRIYNQMIQCIDKKASDNNNKATV